MATLEINGTHISKNIGFIKGDLPLNSSLFGVKASSLSLNSKLVNWIPNGFVISKSLVPLIALDLLRKDEMQQIRSLFDEYINNSSNSLILRSSSCLEWIDGNSYAGLFKSSRDISSYENLIFEIKDCYQQSYNEKIRDYADLKSTVLPEEHLALIIQNQILCDSSALIIIEKNYNYLEYYEDDIINSINGKISPLYTFHNFNKESYKNTVISSLISSEICNIIEVIRDGLSEGESFHLELGISDESVHILQINIIEKLLHNKEFNKRQNKIPSKAEAMKWFNKIGLFNNSLKIYDFISLENLYQNISKDFDFSKSITIRFSLGNDINLPRGFFSNLIDLKNWLNNLNFNKECKVIVHTYINVRRSFELLLDKDKFLLEHIPGMWESDNTLNPDVMYSDEYTVKTWVWNQVRKNLKINDTNCNLDFYENILSEDTIIDWQLKLSKVMPQLRHEFSNILPLNFHFIEDENLEWSFLNIRQGFKLESPEISQSITHIINNKSDIKNWDRKKPLQLQLSTERGNDFNLIELIKELPVVKNKNIIIDFGLLSHPAMILREFGYNLIPNYLYNMNRVFSPNYLCTKFDIKNDPVKRIMAEEALFENNIFKVVNDRKPIIKGHLLVISKQPFTSMIENKNLEFEYDNLIIELKNKKVIANDDYMIIERGRAKFCTSGFTDSHAHAHIIPTDKFNIELIQSFIERISAKKYSSLNDAIETARKSDNEYVMIINKEKGIFLRVMPDNISVEKQLIRNHFSY